MSLCIGWHLDVSSRSDVRYLTIGHDHHGIVDDGAVARPNLASEVNVHLMGSCLAKRERC